MVADIVVFRNQIVHGYATVRDDLVWEILQTYLPTLQVEIDRLFKQSERSGPSSA